MKKFLMPAFSFFALLGVAASTGNTLINARAAANANGWDYDATTPSGNDSKTMFEPSWVADFSSTRLTEKACMLYYQPVYGLRGQHRDRFSLTSLEFTLEMSHMSNLVLVTIGNTAGVYYSEPGNLVTMDILPAKKNTIDGTNNLYMVTLTATQDNHNASIEGFADGSKWADDANFTGVQVTAADNRIHVKFEKISSETTSVTVNDVTKTVSNSILYNSYTAKGLDIDSDQYLMIGGMNSTGKEKVIVEEITDAKHKEYYSSTGAYGKTKALLAELKGMNVDSISAFNTYASKFSTLEYDSLKSYDKAWLNDDYQSVLSKYNSAKETYVIANLENLVSAVNTATTDIKTSEEISAAEKAIKNLQDAYDAVDSSTLTADEKTYYDSIPDIISDAKAKIKTVAVTLYKNAVATYVSAVDNVKDADTLVAAKEAYSKIPFTFESYLSEEEVKTESAKITTAKEKLSSLVTLNNKNVTQGKNAEVLKNDAGELSVVSTGGSTYGAKASGNGLYFENPVDSSNFEVKLNVSQLDFDNTWVSLGIMEKNDMFILAEDDSVTNNKGVFFLITRASKTELSVEIFLCSMSSTRFYDSNFSTKMNIPFAEDVTVKMRNTSKDVGGIISNYFVISFNGVEFSELITVNKMKTVFTNSTDAYFYTCSSGTSAIYTIKSINGKAPLSDSLKPESLAPTTTDTTLSYTLGSNADLNINVDTKDQTISSLKVGTKVVGTQNYSYSNGILTIKAAALNKLTAGDSKITLETAFGSLSWTLTVKAGSGDDTGGGSSSGGDSTSGGETKSGGCGGSIVATSVIASSLALAGIGLVFLRRKEK